ncbi:hypothetical protein RXV94_00325 [Yeosuana sp. MJ-SS3]|uniref:Uncharacterized protein n=1 Tax=Gilvirhabdus luticola TaxID=3079858 RepID=A0ABU3U2H6_9FLAO|nr:hypothetical protein [Yeosuana sp. MJ-SS3]MDU8884583.1 hypothetical protein [Yeosuana sp. MJ-SS3]
MKYLTPEIEALSKNKHLNSLVHITISCGIFQEYVNNKRPKLNYQESNEIK